jgi:hypothetical protein
LGAITRRWEPCRTSARERHRGGHTAASDVTKGVAAANPRREPVAAVSILGLGLALWASLFLGGGVLAQEGDSAKLQLTSSRGSGVTGVATLTEVGGGVEVRLRVEGLPRGGVEHINHIHGGGTCAEDRAGRTAPVTIPLTPIVAESDGTGAATSRLKDLSLEDLFGDDQDRFILLHSEAEKGGGVPPGIACADLERTAGVRSSETLPDSGGINLEGALAGAGALFALWLLASLLPRLVLPRDR